MPRDTAPRHARPVGLARLRWHLRRLFSGRLTGQVAAHSAARAVPAARYSTRVAPLTGLLRRRRPRGPAGRPATRTAGRASGADRERSLSGASRPGPHHIEPNRVIRLMARRRGRRLRIAVGTLAVIAVVAAGTAVALSRGTSRTGTPPAGAALTPVPSTAVPADRPPGTVATIEDTATGGGQSTVSYHGSWRACRNCQVSTGNRTYQYSSAAGDSFTIRFWSTQIVVYGFLAPSGGLAEAVLDAGAPAMVDMYAAVPRAGPVWVSPVLATGAHEVRFTVRGTHSAGATGTVVTFDRAVQRTQPPMAGVDPATRIVTDATTRSGLGWASGTNPAPDMNSVAAAAFGTWRGRPADVAVVYPDRDSWQTIVEPGWLYDNFNGWPGRLVITVPLFPIRQGDLASCARGDYDAHWRTLGETLVARERADSVIRLGWEFNDVTQYWSAKDTTKFVACWRRAATAIRTTDPLVVMDWTINAHGSTTCQGRSTNCYPGDSWVDVIGIDNYDFYPATRDQHAFDTVANAVDGLSWLYAFATAHGKKLAIGEWGVVSGSKSGGGDSAFYIRAMYGWMTAHAANIAYEAYFNQCGPSAVISDIYRCGPVNPKASAAYLSLFGTKEAAAG